MTVEIYTKNWCGYCRMAMALLDQHEIEYKNIDVTSDPEKEQEMIQRSGQRTVPQVFFNNESIGGFTELANLSAKTDLRELLKGSPSDDS